MKVKGRHWTKERWWTSVAQWHILKILPNWADDIAKNGDTNPWIGSEQYPQKWIFNLAIISSPNRIMRYVHNKARVTILGSPFMACSMKVWKPYRFFESIMSTPSISNNSSDASFYEYVECQFGPGDWARPVWVWICYIFMSHLFNGHFVRQSTY